MDRYNPVARTTEVTFQHISQLLQLLRNLLQADSQKDLKKQNKQKNTTDCCLHPQVHSMSLAGLQQGTGTLPLCMALQPPASGMLAQPLALCSSHPGLYFLPTIKPLSLLGFLLCRGRDRHHPYPLTAF